MGREAQAQKLATTRSSSCLTRCMSSRLHAALFAPRRCLSANERSMTMRAYMMLGYYSASGQTSPHESAALGAAGCSVPCWRRYYYYDYYLFIPDRPDLPECYALGMYLTLGTYCTYHHHACTCSHTSVRSAICHRSSAICQPPSANPHLPSAISPSIGGSTPYSIHAMPCTASHRTAPHRAPLPPGTTCLASASPSG